VLAGRFRFGDAEAVARPDDGKRIALEHVAGEIGDGETQIAADRDTQSCGTEAGGLGGYGNARGAGAGQHGPRGVLGGMVRGEDADAKRIGAERVDLECQGAGGQLQAAGGVLQAEECGGGVLRRRFGGRRLRVRRERSECEREKNDG
jgi:hypothetical protein